MKSLPNISHSRNPLDVCRRAHRRRMRKDPKLAACEPGGGWVSMNGEMLGCLPLVDGSIVAYSITTVTEWRVARKEKLPKHLQPVPKIVIAPKVTLTPAEQKRDSAKQALDVLLNVLSDAEHRVANPQIDNAN